ncbi:hypothetical protein RSPO_c02266 [Ralstonia solanacearum Po82]|uniref:Uncharacterized protein n=1 Tax=Ralstonia solanacearum (strain Po82) TaxID=1031711 RepID=F6G367_RALS8|nr:hypothetical protein RSPO_c02266 [Ralstonia solanacearum Po82]
MHAYREFYSCNKNSRQIIFIAKNKITAARCKCSLEKPGACQ